MPGDQPGTVTGALDEADAPIVVTDGLPPKKPVRPRRAVPHRQDAAGTEVLSVDYQALTNLRHYVAARPERPACTRPGTLCRRFHRARRPASPSHEGAGANGRRLEGFRPQ